MNAFYLTKKTHFLLKIRFFGILLEAYFLKPNMTKIRCENEYAESKEKIPFD